MRRFGKSVCAWAAVSNIKAAASTSGAMAKVPAGSLTLMGHASARLLELLRRLSMNWDNCPAGNLTAVVLLPRSSFQHPRNAEILVEVRPVDTHWHDLEFGALLG